MSDTFDHEAEAILEGNRMEMDYSTSEPLQSPLRMSKEIGEVASAFCEAQAEFSAAKKDSTLKVLKKETLNPVYTSKYADLASVIDAALAPLNKHGISVLQPARMNGKSITVMTRLQHKSGQYFESDLTMPVVGFSAQSVGSAITYARRYSLQAMICLAAEDDDGNAASGVGSKEAQKAVADRKVAEYNAKKGTPVANGSLPALFYAAVPESDTYTITGDKSLIEANRDILARYWQPKPISALVLDGEALEATKYTLEQRGVPFKLLKSA